MLFGPPSTARALEVRGLDVVEASPGEVLGATAGQAWAESIGPRVARYLSTRGPAGEGTAGVDIMGNVTGAEPTEAPPAPAMLPPDELNKRYGMPGLKFDAPMAETTAAAIAADRKAAQARAAIIERRGDALSTSAAVRYPLAFATAVLDPVNVAAAFIPFAGPARTARLLAGAAGMGERAAIRAGLGAVEGAAGMAVLEPLNYGLSRAEMNDWHMADALTNIAFGGLLGGGLHAIGGAVADRLTSAGPAARDAMLRGALAAIVEDRPVAVQGVLNLPTVPSYRPVAAAAGDGLYNVFAPGGVRIEARPEVVDLSTLIASHTPDGAVNPAYPHAEGLQPRDRASAASQGQIGEIAANLQPERLGPSPDAGTGAPIVNAAGVIESGNGRALALHSVYERPDLAHRAAAYRAWLESQGHDLTGIDRPVLIGRRTTELSPDQARAFARGANERATLDMSAAEQARADAQRAGQALHLLQPGELASGGNRDFVRAFLAQLPAEERGRLMLADGTLSSEGARRIRAAMMAHAYGDALGPVLERMLNGDVEGMKAVAGALTDVAGPWGRLRRAAADGSIPAEMDITAAIGEAVQLLERARATGKPLREMLAQADAFAAPPSPDVLALLRLLHRDEALTRPLGREALTDLLARYTDEALKVTPGPDMFGTPPATPADILRAVARHIDPSQQAELAFRDLASTQAGRAEDQQASRAAQEAVQANEKPPAPGVADPSAKAAQHVSQQADAAVAELDRLELTPGEQAQMTALREGVQAAEAEARATEAAAMCMVGVR